MEVDVVRKLFPPGFLFNLNQKTMETHQARPYVSFQFPLWLGAFLQAQAFKVLGSIAPKKLTLFIHQPLKFTRGTDLNSALHSQTRWMGRDKATHSEHPNTGTPTGSPSSSQILYLVRSP